MKPTMIENVPKNNHPDLLTGNITKSVVRLSLPLAIAMLFQTGFSAIDMIFLGMVSPQAIAAVGMVFPVLYFFVSFVMGVGVGLTSFIAREIGAGNIEKAGRIAANGIAFSIVMSSSLAFLGVAFSRPLFTALGAGPEIIESVLTYSRILFVGFVFLFFAAFCTSIIRGEGDTKTPMKFMLIATLINLILDPILIFGVGPVPMMGVKGAALAMVFSRSIMVVLVVRHFVIGKSLVKPTFKNFRFDFAILKEILRVGIPSTITNMSASIGLMVFMRLVAGYGPLAIAAYGIGGRIESIAILPAFGMAGGVLTVVGQNYGAMQLERARQAIKSAVVLIAGFMLGIGMLALVFSNGLLYIFTDDPAVIAFGKDFLLFRAPFFALVGVRMTVSSGFAGAGNPKVGLLTLLFGLFIVGLPTAMILNDIVGLNAMWIGLSSSNVAGSSLAFFLFLWGFPSRKESKQGAVTPIG
jgi:putative MATE family efflux protein